MKRYFIGWAGAPIDGIKDCILPYDMSLTIKGNLTEICRFPKIKINLFKDGLAVHTGDAIIDTGSMYNLISPALVNRLNLKKRTNIKAIVSSPVNGNSNQENFFVKFTINNCPESFEQTFVTMPFQPEGEEVEEIIIGNDFLSGCTEFKINGTQGTFELHM